MGRQKKVLDELLSDGGRSAGRTASAFRVFAGALDFDPIEAVVCVKPSVLTGNSRMTDVWILLVLVNRIVLKIIRSAAHSGFNQPLDLYGRGWWLYPSVGHQQKRTGQEIAKHKSEASFNG